jgi:hypothetical protein
MEILLKIGKAILFIIVYSLINYLFLLAIFWVTPHIMWSPWWALLLIACFIGSITITMLFIGLPYVTGILINKLSSQTLVEICVCGLVSLFFCIVAAHGAWILKNIFGAIVQNILTVLMYISVFSSLFKSVRKT